MKKTALLLTILVLAVCAVYAQNGPWPAVQPEMRPWTRWWWHGNSVTKAGIRAELEAFQKAGIGGVELTPIFGTLGDEAQFIPFLSPQWVSMLEYTLQEAARLGLGVDIATGTGWPFGGPWVSEADACKYAAYASYSLKGGERLQQPVMMRQKPVMRVVANAAYQKWVSQNPGTPDIPAWITQKRAPKIDDIVFPVAANRNLQALALDQVRFPHPMTLQTLMAYSSDGQVLNLTNRVDSKGVLNWKAPKGSWKLYAVFQGNHGKMVERAAPGGEGNVIDHFAPEAVTKYLSYFDQAFRGKQLGGLRAFFSDSYEVDDAAGQADWTPALFTAFEAHRGYDLRNHLPALFGHDEPAKNTRILSDYRETISELLLESFTQEWGSWARAKGAIIRNQSHGSPANVLDLYAASDIPETEGIDLFKIKFASSAAHVTGKKLVSAEAATWLDEHFRSNLADLKKNLDRYFAGGVNHILYHGTSYSPPGEPWPGRLFYAAIHANPRNTLWADLGAINQYVTRTQSMLQRGQSDNDILVYHPIYDAYAYQGAERLQHFETGKKGMEGMTVEQVADTLLAKGYTFDFISDQQIRTLQAADGLVESEGQTYKVVVIPACRFIPLEVLEKLDTLARSGVRVIIHQALPGDVPGYGQLEQRQARFRALLGTAHFQVEASLEQGLTRVGVTRERMADMGLTFSRRSVDSQVLYFIANWTNKDLDTWIPLASTGSSVFLQDPMRGTTGFAQTRTSSAGGLEVHIQLPQGTSMIALVAGTAAGAPWAYIQSKSTGMPLQGLWNVRFLSGGPELPPTQEITELKSWTTFPAPSAISFSGTARYSLTFSRPTTNADSWQLDLGRVAESARVRLNGTDLGTLVGPRYLAFFPSALLQDQNILEVEVSNLMANRIADMDRRGIYWKKFYNTNFPSRLAENRGNDGLFTASGWEPLPSGLLGPVVLTPLY